MELKSVSLRAFTVFLGHTAYRLLVTSHVFCSDSHTARPSAVHSSVFGFVIRLSVCGLTAVLHFVGLVAKCGSCTLPVQY